MGTDEQEENVLEATPTEDTPQEKQRKNKAKRQTQSKKKQQLEGEPVFSVKFLLLWMFLILS